MNRFLYFVLVLFIASCDSSNPEEVIVDPENPVLVSIDVKDALALTFGYASNKRHLQTIHANKTIGEPVLTFKGESQGLGEDFVVVEMNSEYYLLVAPTFEQIYFVDKKTGAAKQSAYFPIDYLNTGKIACHGATCYFIDQNHKLYRLTNFLSTEAEFEVVTSVPSADWIETDVDGTFFVWDTGRFVLEGEKQTTVPLHAGFWKGRDGYMRIIDAEGKISKYTGSKLDYEQSIPYSVTKIGATSFPQQKTTIGFQYKYDLLMFFELEPPYKATSWSAPNMSDDVKPFLGISSTGFGKYFYLLYGLPNKSKELRKVDVTTFTSTTSAVIAFNSYSVFKALQEDLIMMVVCRTPDGCADEMAFLNADGSFTFPPFWGMASIRYVTF